MIPTTPFGSFPGRRLPASPVWRPRAAIGNSRTWARAWTPSGAARALLFPPLHSTSMGWTSTRRWPPVRRHWPGAPARETNGMPTPAGPGLATALSAGAIATKPTTRAATTSTPGVLPWAPTMLSTAGWPWAWRWATAVLTSIWTAPLAAASPLAPRAARLKARATACRDSLSTGWRTATSTVSSATGKTILTWPGKSS